MRLWLATAERMVRYAFDLSAALRDADNEMGDAIAAELVRMPSQAATRAFCACKVLRCRLSERGSWAAGGRSVGSDAPVGGAAAVAGAPLSPMLHRVGSYWTVTALVVLYDALRSVRGTVPVRFTGCVVRHRRGLTVQDTAT